MAETVISQPVISAANTTARNALQATEPTTPAVHADYTHDQLTNVLESIASQMHTLTNLLRMAQISQEKWEIANLIDAAQAMASGVGCMADHASGYSVMGDFDSWQFGPNFHDAQGQSAQQGTS